MKIEVITVGPIDENCHIVYCDEHRSAIIVDPGDSGKRIIAFLRENELIPKLIVNTHCHADHTGAVAPLVDHCLRAPTTDTQRAQECHITAGHLLCEIIEREMF